MIGEEIHRLARQLWPINRSLTGDGVRETLSILKIHLPGLSIHEVPSGTKAFDWTVPKEWRIRSGWIKTPSGRTICNFDANNIHVLGYSTPIRQMMPLAELQKHLYSLPEQPEAIPYVTSYYKERWGFCISERERASLEDGLYEVHIDSELFDGNLTYGELLIPGTTDEEVFFSTYVCHPSMANNELSGPCVATFLAKWVAALPKRHYSYRFVFIPETIGSIIYLSRNLPHLQAKVVAGFNISCIGDDRAYSYLPSRRGNTRSDEVALHVLKHVAPDFVSYSWKDRGSDERQYCAPHVDLPIASVMRTKYGVYPEYHTSLDDLENVVVPSGLEGGYMALRRCVEALELNCYPSVTVLCEPQLGPRGLYPTLSAKGSANSVRLMMDALSWCDGTKSLLEVADLCGAPIWKTHEMLAPLIAGELIKTERKHRDPVRRS